MKAVKFTIDQWGHFLQNDNTEMYSVHNEEKSFVPEKLIKTLKNKIIKNTKFISMKKNGKKRKKSLELKM